MRVGGVVFDHRAEAVQAPTRDREALRLALREKMRPSGGTATGDALATSLAMLQARRSQDAKRPPAAVVLLSDGKSTHGRDPLPVADRARELGVPVYTVALGTSTGTLPDGERVPPDTEALREIAERSGGRAFTASEAGGAAARSTSGSARRSRRSARTARSPRCSPAARSRCSSAAPACRCCGSGAWSESAFRRASGQIEVGPLS